jgi:AcrR family transcriptional regulator
MVTQKRVEMSQKLKWRSEIYCKALDLFIQKGFNGASISMIAKSLGMSKSSLYHYCSSKEDLFYKVHLDYLEKHLIPIVEEAEQLPDPKDRIAFVLRKLTLLNATDKACRVLVPDIVNLNRSHHSEIISIWRRVYDVVYNSIKELHQLGKATKFRESFQTLLGFGMANWTSFWFDYARQSNAEELAETMVQTFLNGLLSPLNEKH